MRSVKKYHTKLKEISIKGTLGVLTIHENVETTLCSFCIAHLFILILSVVQNFNVNICFFFFFAVFRTSI